MNPPPPIPELTEDRLLGGRLRLMQPASGYRAAVDPILLAAACPMIAGQTVLDVGVGTGAALLALARRVRRGRFVGLEVRPEIAAIAQRNAVLNEIAAEVVTGDVRRPPFPPDSVDHVLTNPPYAAGGTPPPDPAKAMAHMEGDVDLKDWLRGCLYVLRARGWITIIQRADRVDDVIAALAGRCGAVSIIPIWSHAGDPARRVIVRARKGTRSPATLHAGLVLHGTETKYTDAAEAVLREGAPLFLDTPERRRS
ncbi:tRNA1(Val) (adenine(37)-N6)-methyltransferase [Caenispirillum salinarum]|uniref:tRNA1(Val) (adenine(37)-N6)-methyltransferase n=1 Tax=Caenispirillum salinarum TaxID=859058 RepID=UPI0038512346